MLALFTLLVCIVGCGDRPRTVRIVDARALYDGAHGDTAGVLLVDGEQVASCTRPWLLPECVCDVDAEVNGAKRLRLELALDIGATSREVDVRGMREGRHVIALETESPIAAATVTLELQIEPIFPRDAALVLAVLLGIAAAFLLVRLVGASVVSEHDGKPRGTAINCARVAMIAAYASVLPLAAYAKKLEPLVVAIPTLLGAFAAAAIVIDAMKCRHLGRHRASLLVNALAAAAFLPIIAALATLSFKWLVVVVGVMVIAAFVS